MNAQQALDEITAHINKSNYSCSDWYAGITSDIDQRLHGDHKVPRKDHWFAHRTTDTANDARAVEEALLKSGCDGGTGGGDATARTVYAYLKTQDTAP